MKNKYCKTCKNKIPKFKTDEKTGIEWMSTVCQKCGKEESRTRLTKGLIFYNDEKDYNDLYEDFPDNEKNE